MFFVSYSFTVIMFVSRYSKHWILKLCIYNTICIFLGQNKSGGNNMAIVDYNFEVFFSFQDIVFILRYFLHFKVFSLF